MPLRVELGPKDMEGGKVMTARRDNGAKEVVAWDDLAARVPAILETIQVWVGVGVVGGSALFPLLRVGEGFG